MLQAVVGDADQPDAHGDRRVPRPIDDPVELYIGDRLIARGELQELGDDSGRLGVRLTEVADFSHEL